MTAGDRPGAVKIDRRTARTRRALREALLDLVRTRELNEITVADVADRADVSRPTFYGHYRDTGELAADASSTMIDELVCALPALRSSSDDSILLAPRSLEAFFDNLQLHQGLYRSLFGPTGSALVLNDVRSRIADAVAGATESAAQHVADGSQSCRGSELDATFTGGALVAVAADWVAHGCPGSSADMAASVWPILAAQYGIGLD